MKSVPVGPTIAIMAITLLSFVASFGLTSRASAYNNYDNMPCKWAYGGGSSQLNVTWRANPSYPPSGDYFSAFSEGRNDWYDTNTPLVFQSSSSGTSLHGAGYFGTSYPLGSATLAASGSFCGSGATYLNMSRLDSLSYTSKRLTAGHELGHNAGLGHSTASASLMRSPGNIAYYVPQADDVCGINTKYVSTSWPATGC
jgi:Matrixin